MGFLFLSFWEAAEIQHWAAIRLLRAGSDGRAWLNWYSAGIMNAKYPMLQFCTTDIQLISG